MTITAAIKKIEAAKAKSNVTDSFHIYEKRVCSKYLKDKRDLSQYKLIEYLDIESLIIMLNQIKCGIIKKDNNFITLFAGIHKIINIIEKGNTNIFWYVDTER